MQRIGVRQIQGEGEDDEAVYWDEGDVLTGDEEEKDVLMEGAADTMEAFPEVVRLLVEQHGPLVEVESWVRKLIRHDDPWGDEDGGVPRRIFALRGRLGAMEALSLYYVDEEGVSYKETARLLGCSQSTINTSLSRGRNKVKDE